MKFSYIKTMFDAIAKSKFMTEWEKSISKVDPNEIPIGGGPAAAMRQARIIMDEMRAEREAKIAAQQQSSNIHAKNFFQENSMSPAKSAEMTAKDVQGPSQ